MDAHVCIHMHMEARIKLQVSSLFSTIVFEVGSFINLGLSVSDWLTGHEPRDPPVASPALRLQVYMDKQDVLRGY